MDGRHAVPIGLVVGLNAVNTSDALSLSQLLRRTGMHSIGELSAALPDQMKDDVLRAAVGRWIDGDDLPTTWTQLESLVRLMDATDDEVAAFSRRTSGSTPSVPPRGSALLTTWPNSRPPGRWTGSSPAWSRWPLPA